MASKKNKKSKHKDKIKNKKGKVAKKKRDAGGFPEMIYLLKGVASEGGNRHVESLDEINESQVVGVYKLRRPSHVDVKRKIVRNPKDTGKQRPRFEDEDE